MKPSETNQPFEPCWTRRGVDRPYDGPPPKTQWPWVKAVSEHPHWAKERVPGRKVLRQQARRRGEFKPVRLHHSKRRNSGTSATGAIYRSSRPSVADRLHLPSFLRLGSGDR